MEILGLISCALLGGSFLCSTGRRYREGCLDYTADGVRLVCNGVSEYCCCCCCAVRTVEQEFEGVDVSIPISPNRVSYVSYGSIIRSEVVAIKDDSDAPKSEVEYPELLSKSPNSRLIAYGEYTVLENICHSGPGILDRNEAADRRLISASNDYGEFMRLSSDDSEQPQQQQKVEVVVEEKQPASPSFASGLFDFFPLKSKSVRDDPFIEPADSNDNGDLSPLQKIRDASMTGSSKLNKKVGFNGEVEVAEYGYYRNYDFAVNLAKQEE